MGFLTGKKALIIGVASNRSIAWGIAESMAANGCEVAFTYQTDKLKSRVEKCAEICNSSIVIPCDVSSDEQINETFAELKKSWANFDIIVHSVAFADRAELDGNYVEVTTREGFLKAHEISSYSFTAIAKAALPMLNENGALLTLSYLGALRAIPNYNVMGVAKAALESATRYLANDLGPDGIRVNAISPGPMKTLAGAAISGARKTYKHTDQNAPMRSNATLEAVGGTAVYLASDVGAYTTGEIIRVDGGYHVLGMPQPDHL